MPFMQEVTTSFISFYSLHHIIEKLCKNNEMGLKRYIFQGCLVNGQEIAVKRLSNIQVKAKKSLKQKLHF
jgi:hypothetical protein